MNHTTNEFRSSVVSGLSETQKTINCKYFYDEVGSELFEKICKTTEYYITRTETQILTNCVSKIGKIIGENAEVIELGSGSSSKTRLVLHALNKPWSYKPVDISSEYLMRAVTELQPEFPKLVISPVVADFTETLHISRRCGQSYRLLFFPGSTIGNFNPEEAIKFLSRMINELNPSYFLIGFDLIKDKKILESAYNDASGITAQFNMNLLRRINIELDGTFDISQFRHDAHYNQIENRVEMHIVSLKAQRVSIGKVEFNFRAGESIHTENSYKYSCDSFKGLVAEAGWCMERVWMDEDNYFAVALLAPAQPQSN